jgi:hypothetical protein
VVDVRDVDIESAAREAGTLPIVLKAGKRGFIGESQMKNIYECT